MKSGQDGIKLPPFLQKGLEDLADGQEITVKEMLCKIVHQTINPGQNRLTTQKSTEFHNQRRGYEEGI